MRGIFKSILNFGHGQPSQPRPDAAEAEAAPAPKTLSRPIRKAVPKSAAPVGARLTAANPKPTRKVIPVVVPAAASARIVDEFSLDALFSEDQREIDEAPEQRFVSKPLQKRPIRAKKSAPLAGGASEAREVDAGPAEPESDSVGRKRIIPGGKRLKLKGEVGERAALIEKSLSDLGVPAHVVAATVGPTITRFGIVPAIIESYTPDGKLRRRERIRVAKIVARERDLALALGARSLRLEAPVPGHSYIGLEVPNLESTKVELDSLLRDRLYREFADSAMLPVPVGRDVAGGLIKADITRLPHLLVAGSTGSGKSVALNALLAALLSRLTPEALRIIVIDPKRVEFTWLEGVAHLLAPVCVDCEVAVELLGKLETEMSRRYDLLAAARTRDIKVYNAKLAEKAAKIIETGKMAEVGASPLPYLVVIVDELADLMMLASNDVERSICRVAQLGRAAGIHLIVATQRPSVDVITGLIKANLPSRLAFATMSAIDSRTILDTGGAETLLGRGDLLYLPSDQGRPIRGQGALVSDEALEKLAKKCRRKRGKPDAYAEAFSRLRTAAAQAAEEMLGKARELAAEHDRISASFLQRKLRIGYARAKELYTILEDEGLVGGEDS